MVGEWPIAQLLLARVVFPNDSVLTLDVRKNNFEIVEARNMPRNLIEETSRNWIMELEINQFKNCPLIQIIRLSDGKKSYKVFGI